ncbi:Hypothetical protein DHA2_150454 [Giardia duodenalis]|uniref:Uncharacterized protein n=1 Tax=Giardia intestinalis TaxID=5741 RepID=V6TDX0_GIAIN|nr:Hypothetical protein DHA2_150454 [Giardia intestinalis]
MMLLDSGGRGRTLCSSLLGGVAGFLQCLLRTSPSMASPRGPTVSCGNDLGHVTQGHLVVLALHDEGRMCHGLGMPTRVPPRLLVEQTIDPAVGVRSPYVLLDCGVCPWTPRSIHGWCGGDARSALLLMNRSAPVVPGGQQPVHTRRHTPCAVCRLGWCGLHPSVPQSVRGAMSRSAGGAGPATALRETLSEVLERSEHSSCTMRCSPRGRPARQPAVMPRLTSRCQAPRSCLWWTPDRRCPA